MTEEIVEIRDYTIETEWFPAYCDWARDHAVPWLKENLDVIDFWLDDGLEPMVLGSDPQVSPHGQPNVCWIIRWPSLEARAEGWEAMQHDPTWAEVIAHHPNRDSYLHTNVRFMRPAIAV